MHGTSMRYLLVGAGALVVGLLIAGTSLLSLLPYALILACPLMMVFMMRGVGGPTGHGAEHTQDRPARDRDDATAGR